MNAKNITSKFKSIIFLILPFLVYFLVATYKLSEPSLWVNECLQRHYAIQNFEDFYFLVSRTSFQSPLYPFILSLWIKVNDGVFWMRFLSVLFGFFGAIGFYKSVKEVSGQNLALFSVIVYSCVFRLIYNFQEVTEYAFMIGNMCWAAYYFIKTLKNMDIKNIVLFNIFGALSFASQYSALIVIMAFSFFLFLKAVINKNIQEVKNIIVSYIINLTFVCLPIYHFYMKTQLPVVFDKNNVFNVPINQNIFWDFYQGFIQTVKYNFFPNLTYETNEIFMNFHVPDIVVNILAYLFLIVLTISVVRLLKSKRNRIIIISMVKKPKSEKSMIIVYLIWSSILSWCIYYSLVKAGLYSYGEFGFRWGIFITPLWLLTAIVTISDFLTELGLSYSKLFLKIGKILSYSIVFLTAIYCFTGVYGVYKHWEKEDTKGMVQRWYEIEGYKEKTILYYGAKYGFMYYLEKDPRFDESYKNNIVKIPWVEDGDYYEFRAIISKLLDNNFNFPVIYLCFAHTGDDMHTILLLFKDKGYKVSIIYDEHDAVICKLVKK